MESIIAAAITGALALVGVVITNLSSNKKIETRLITSQAVTEEKIGNLDSKLSDLADEVRKHNSFADRITKLEVKVDALEKRFKD